MGNRVSEARHAQHPYGEERWHTSTLPTDYRFTGQRLSAELGLYQMGARWVDPALGRWLSADTVVPALQDPQSLNRYSYVGGKVLRYIDPTGHFKEEQLRLWYGEQWRDLFDEIWESILENG